MKETTVSKSKNETVNTETKETNKSLSTQLPLTTPEAVANQHTVNYNDRQTSSQECLPSAQQLVDTVRSNCSVESELGTSTSQLTQPPQRLTSIPPSLSSSSQPRPSGPLSLSTSQCTSQPSIQQECKL